MVDLKLILWAVIHQYRQDIDRIIALISGAIATQLQGTEGDRIASNDDISQNIIIREEEM